MKRPGLTESMRRALDRLRFDAADATPHMREKLLAAGLTRRASPGSPCDLLTPRGQAALAAPRVTAAELAMLELLAANGNPWSAGKHHVESMLNRFEERGWVNDTGWRYYLSKDGTTAINNIRAASGSPDYKEN